MKIEKLDGLDGWQLTLTLLGLGLVTALTVWGLVWVVWTIRPLLAACAAVGAVGWVLYSLHRHRRDSDWIGS